MDTEELAKLLALPSLASYLRQIEKQLRSLINAAEPEIAKPALRILNSGGKRLRPSLVTACASLGGRPNKAFVPAASAVELIHLASLVHDDIIDGSKLRRGVPTINELEGTSRAILVGDYLLAAGLGLAASVSQAAASELADAVLSLCDGQALELTGNYRRDPADKLYIRISRKKSGSLMSAACRIGGAGAGLSEAKIDALGKYGEEFGIAFQILDDITDGDFNKETLSIAVPEAIRHSAQAANELKILTSHPVAAGLAKLPGVYADGALAKINFGTAKKRLKA